MPPVKKLKNHTATLEVLKKFESHINTHLSFLKDKKLLIAISGGLDSIVLTHLSIKSKLQIALAHCNFNLRGQESDDDENFVIDLANKLDIEVFVQHFDTQNYAESNKLSIQMAARELRYEWFKELSIKFGFDYILTAHHADDALETFLINLSRGTGISGLLGIPEINSIIVRPLLPFPRTAIFNYADKENIAWREDSSNTSIKYQRNELRHDIIPKLKNSSPNFLNNFQNTIEHLKDSESILTTHIESVINKSITKTNVDVIHFSIKIIEKLNPLKTYLYYIFKQYNFSDWESIKELLFTQSGKQVLSKTHRLLKNRDELILSPLRETDDFKELLIFKNTQQIDTASGTILIENALEIQNSDTCSIFVDEDKIKYPLKIRKWQKGDYFCPLGMLGRKKLSKFFKDEKLSLIDKKNVLLLCSDEKIIWVINYRSDNRFKVSNTTNSILKISCNT